MKTIEELAREAAAQRAAYTARTQLMLDELGQMLVALDGRHIPAGTVFHHNVVGPGERGSFPWGGGWKPKEPK